jgi:hypothetical protein
MNDGHSLTYDYKQQRLKHETINASSWPGLEPYKHRIITAVQNDRTLADSYLYIFLTNHQYIRYNMPLNRAQSAPSMSTTSRGPVCWTTDPATRPFPQDRASPQWLIIG